MDGTREGLSQLLEQITLPDERALAASRRHWDNIAKPLKGLGIMEELIIKIAGIQGREEVELEKKAVIVMCSDNGVVAEGVTQTDSHVTAVVTENFARGIASVNRMAAVAGADVIPVDIGVAEDLREPGILNRKIAYGTKNFAKEPAMSEAEAVQGILTGMEIVKECKAKGYHLLATGEMGIGNTTTSSAMASVLLNVPVTSVTGKGAGLSDAGLRRKVAVIEEAVKRRKPDPADVLSVLSNLGGFDIAGMTGVFLGGALYRIPVVMDGVISSVAALAAARLCPESVHYMLASHLSNEPAGAMIMKELGLEPVIHGRLALGEGTGAVMLFPLLEMAYEVYLENSTFENIKIEAYEHFDGNGEM